jgi:hypothetical protein
MSRLLTFWLLSLIVVAACASIVTAQVTRTTPRVSSGADVGFRVEGTDSRGRPVGTLVIKMNGDWVPVVEAPKPSPVVSGG